MIEGIEATIEELEAQDELIQSVSANITMIIVSAANIIKALKKYIDG